MILRNLNKAELRQAYLQASNKYWEMVHSHHSKLALLHETEYYKAVKQNLEDVLYEMNRRRLQ